MTILCMGTLGYAKLSILGMNFSLKDKDVKKLVLAEFFSNKSTAANLE